MRWKRGAALLLAAGLLLNTGCAALLEREYSSVTVHSATPKAEGDSAALRVESYQELVNALLYLIIQQQQTGTIRLYNYPQDRAEEDLAAASLEVVQEDPLGAYCVDFIKYDVTTIVSYEQADIQIAYRRTPEQVAAIVTANGASAIRGELRTALAAFQQEVVLRVGYFDGEEQTIQSLLQEAYYAVPEAALGLPQAQVHLYPDTGKRRIVELVLSYPAPVKELERQRTALADKATELVAPYWGMTGDQTVLELAGLVLDQGGVLEEGGSTAYHALLEGGADSQGVALAMALLCQRQGIPCLVVVGERAGVPHTWNVVSTESGYRHLDLAQVGEDLAVEDLFTDRQASEGGYLWDEVAVPQCGERLETLAPDKITS